MKTNVLYEVSHTKTDLSISQSDNASKKGRTPAKSGPGLNSVKYYSSNNLNNNLNNNLTKSNNKSKMQLYEYF